MLSIYRQHKFTAVILQQDVFRPKLVIICLNTLIKHFKKKLNSCYDKRIVPFLGAFTKLRKATINLLMSVRPHGTTRLPLDGFLLNLVYEHFSKICWENSSFVKIGPEWRVLCMGADSHFWSYLAQFFLEWEMLQTKAVQNIKTRILCSITLIENRARYEMWKNMLETDRPQVTIWLMHIACWIPKATNIDSRNMYYFCTRTRLSATFYLFIYLFIYI